MPFQECLIPKCLAHPFSFFCISQLGWRTETYIQGKSSEELYMLCKYVVVQIIYALITELAINVLIVTA